MQGGHRIDTRYQEVHSTVYILTTRLWLYVCAFLPFMYHNNIEYRCLFPFIQQVGSIGRIDVGCRRIHLALYEFNLGSMQDVGGRQSFTIILFPTQLRLYGFLGLDLGSSCIFPVNRIIFSLTSNFTRRFDFSQPNFDCTVSWDSIWVLEHISGKPDYFQLYQQIYTTFNFSQPNFDRTGFLGLTCSISGSFQKFGRAQFPENQKFWLIFSIFRLKTHCSSLLTAHQKPEGTIRAYMYHRYSSMKYGGMQHKKIGKTKDASVLCSLNEFVMPVHVRTYTYDI